MACDSIIQSFFRAPDFRTKNFESFYLSFNKQTFTDKLQQSMKNCTRTLKRFHSKNIGKNVIRNTLYKSLLKTKQTIFTLQVVSPLKRKLLLRGKLVIYYLVKKVFKELI